MFLVSSVMLVLLFIDNTAGNPHPSFGSSHKSNKLGNCCVFYYLFYANWMFYAI